VEGGLDEWRISKALDRITAVIAYAGGDDVNIRQALSTVTILRHGDKAKIHLPVMMMMKMMMVMNKTQLLLIVSPDDSVLLRHQRHGDGPSDEFISISRSMSQHH